MKLFDSKTCVGICLKNHNRYVRLAVEDMCKDFSRISRSHWKPSLMEEECDGCIVIEENVCDDGDPIAHEGFILKSEGNILRISADGYLGTMWGIYTFCEKYLGVDPCYLFQDRKTEEIDVLELPSVYMEESPKSFGFRGVFLNDEDLLTGWRDGGGIRDIDYKWYSLTVDPSAIEMIVETVLRLRLNLVIPASFLNIDNPPEKLLADCVTSRGIYISQHHVEPLGVSHFTLQQYCKKFGKTGEYSYLQNPQLLDEAWKYYAEKWAEYDNVVWQIGLRGKADRPVWEEAVVGREELLKYGEFISLAMEHQKNIAVAATNGNAKYFTSTLWMEGSRLLQEGALKLPEEAIAVFSDTGPDQMYGDEFYSVSREGLSRRGIYYHLQYYGNGPHLAPMTDIHKLYYNLKLAKEKGDDRYIILNVSNVREFVFELGAYAEMVWDIDRFSEEIYFRNYCTGFGDYSEEIMRLVKRYYEDFPCIDEDFYLNSGNKFFNFNREKTPEGIKRFIVKDGVTLITGRKIIESFHRADRIPVCEAAYSALKEALPKYSALCEEFKALAEKLPEPLKKHVEVKWLCYVTMLKCIYRWFLCLVDARKCRQEMNSDGMKRLLNEACDALTEYLEYRKCAEYDEFENWYRGEIKLDVKQKLYDTQRLLGQS